MKNSERKGQILECVKTDARAIELLNTLQGVDSVQLSKEPVRCAGGETYAYKAYDKEFTLLGMVGVDDHEGDDDADVYDVMITF